MTIAVTGGTGLLGSYLLQKLVRDGFAIRAIVRKNPSAKQNGHQVTWVEGDVTDVDSLKSAFSKCDCVVHAAGLVSFNPKKEDELIQVNTVGTRNVVNACLAVGVKKLVFISSVAAFGRQKGVTQINEETKWVDGNLNSHYAKSKYLAELEVYRGQEEGLDISIVCPSVILANADWNTSSARIFKYIWENGRFYTRGKVNYVDGRDVAQLVASIIQKNRFGEKYIANAGSIEFIDLFKAIAQRLGKKNPTIKVNSHFAMVGAFLSEVKAGLTGDEPMVTRQSIKMTRADFFYDSSKSQVDFGLKYQSLENTLDWCCKAYLERFYTTNKQ